MRFTFPFAAAGSLLLAGCATAPKPAPPPIQPQSPLVRSTLIGLTASELVQRLGAPDFQVREGAGLKLQFRGPACVLDAYLYPSAGSADRVTYVDARRPSGVDTDQPACIAALQGP